MTPDEAFLHDIIENPDDDTPRLVYADWLDEHGQSERAELIRVQCELARLPNDDSPALVERRDELETREKLLLKGHRDEWAGPLRGRVDSSSFRRGFPAAIEIDAATFLSQGDAPPAGCTRGEGHLKNARGRPGDAGQFTTPGPHPWP